MFTGLIQERGRVASVRASDAGVRLRVEAALAGELREGDSVAVSGVCLTAAAVEEGAFEADVVPETLSRSSLRDAEAGNEVNLELALRPADRLGGHLVQGHVDGVGKVMSAAENGAASVLTIAAGADLLRHLVEKGSVAVDGVSLTVASVEDDSFTVALIPETLERTSLGSARAGRHVNLEVDVLAKYVDKYVGTYVGSLEPRR